MNTPAPRPFSPPRRARHLAAAIVVLLLTPVLLTACGGAAMSQAPAIQTGPMIGAVDDAAMTPVDLAAWNGRPAYVKTADAQTQEAYAFAVQHGDILQWMPCYCGCTAMGHGSNLDCFLRSHDAAGTSFQEHASVCDVCVKTALMAKTMHAEGHSLLEIRQAIDKSFGNTGAPGTVTALPPA